MKHVSRVRCAAAAIVLGGFAVAGIGFSHDFRPDPGWSGGHVQAVAIQHVHVTGPTWGGGVQPADLSYPQPDQVHEGGPAWGGGLSHATPAADWDYIM